MTPHAEKLLSDVGRYSATQSAEAKYYWQRHEPRYRYLAAALEDLRRRMAVRRILDVGMSFEVPLLAGLFPDARVDCMGVYEDERFRPPRAYSFYNVDLNDAAMAARPLGDPPPRFDVIVFMEVLEHLIVPPELVLRFLGSLLSDGGHLVVTTPNAAWLKNRLKLLQGKNPFELLKPDRKNMGHIREYTKPELQAAITAAGLECVRFERRGLYRFNNPKDNLYSRAADLLHPSLRRTLVAICRRGK